MWNKIGIIYCPNNENSWSNNSFMTPVAVNLNDEIIRIFGGVRDRSGISRLTFIDVKASNPLEVINISKNPVLDIGENGCFDDNGVILGDIKKIDDEYRMYYIGFQKVEKVKFLAFTGLATSKNLKDFTKFSKSPIFDRKNWAPFIGAIHSIIKEKNKYRIFYASGYDWKTINNICYPVYSSYYTESVDGVNFDFKINKEIISPSNDIYRIGRPTAYKIDDHKFQLYCSYDTINKNYGLKCFESSNCIDWIEEKSTLKGLEKPILNFDDQAICYPSIVNTKYGKYFFYNGNQMGLTGLGCAKFLVN